MTTTSPVRAMFATILRQMLILLAVLAVGGSAVGYLIAGSSGLWGALLGAGVVAFFMLTTAAVMLATAERPMHIASAAFMGSWVAKVAVIFVALLVLREETFYSPGVFFVVLSLAIIGSVAIEIRGALQARVPYVQPQPPHTRPGSNASSRDET